ncbi:T9SS type A sorting domain-containing protein [Mangrovimonas cancribranchiae]|uniref:T9SS type A sorting domain-containing protein n=1 Tax=Mangrovimonas cancribranchiae TaxID=3080055 RepID=A0AAU6P145_9FLAO
MTKTISLFILGFISVLGISNPITAQTVDLDASVIIENSLQTGDTFVYTLKALPETPFNGLQVYLTYDPNVIQPTQIHQVFEFDAILQHDLNVPGLIKFSAGNLGSLITENITVFNIEFEILNNTGLIEISHITSQNASTQVSNQHGENLVGYTNTITLQRLGIDNTNTINGLLIYPNPVSDQIHIDVGKNNGLQSVAFFDLNGKQVLYFDTFDVNSQQTSINLSKLLRNGTYFMHVRTNKQGKSIYKIVMNH